MRPIPTLLCLVMLSVSGARLALLGVKELQRYRSSQNDNSLNPNTGSFAGIGADGGEKRPNLDDNGHLLLFVIHHSRIRSDIDFWNQVIILAGQSHRQARGNIKYWGICDSGAECDPYQSEAHFTILGHLEPFEMRIMAGADANGDALLYNQSNVLNGRVAHAPCPAAQANLILQSAK